MFYVFGQTPIFGNQQPRNQLASEILRIIIGSVGLILAVPFTTMVAAWYFGNKDVSHEEVHEGHTHHHQLENLQQNE